ncbi:ComEC/Rec2 family competence protein, partial [Rhodovulum sulfidophilum]|uniref:ComEC/Rec2 family competence protein n=1 Tax=Rhodovulum sulfidophilum TaxID=35806 RepID=UPI001F261A7B
SMSRDTIQALRDSNLAHLLAISGLHMGLLTGVIFAALRFALALWPRLALRLPVKKIAAAGALAVGAVYLALSGGNVATERAFIMVAAVLGAVMADRRALTLRAVALAALIVLVLTPESLTQAGFQMSFAATTALIAVFAALRDRPEGGWRPPRWAQGVLAVVISSAVAGAATAPFGAAHFNQVSQFGLLANLASVPLMGLLVMPAAVAAACLAPFGLAGLGLEPMRWGK